MRQTFKVRFYCRPTKIRKDGTAPVEVSIIVNGEREWFQLPRSCEPSKYPTQDLALYLDGVRNKINGIYTALSIANEPITAFILKDAYLNGAATSYTLKRMFEDGLKLKSAQNNAVTAYRKYELMQEKFFKYTGLNPNSEAGKVTHLDILQFKANLDSIHKPVTVEKEMMRLKYFFLLAFNSGKTKANPFAAIKIRRPKTENIFLTEEELQRLINAEITDDKIDKARDIFVFMAGTGLEWADLCTLAPNSVQKYGKLHYVKGRRVKTGIEYIAVVQDFAMEIWDFYGGKIPKLSNQKLNKYLKTCQKIAKIDKNLTTLCARHTYATMALNRGLSMDIVSKMLGHTSTAQTKTYAELLSTTVLDANEALKSGDLSALKKSPYKPLKISVGTSTHIGRESLPETKIAGTGEDWEEELRKLSEALGI